MAVYIYLSVIVNLSISLLRALPNALNPNSPIHVLCSHVFYARSTIKSSKARLSYTLPRGAGNSYQVIGRGRAISDSGGWYLGFEVVCLYCS
jgi:hypothetical protein